MANRKAYKNGLQSQFHSGKEAVKAGRAGGIASGKSRRRWATLREAFADLMTDDDRIFIFDAMKRKAQDGDIRAAEFLRDTMGEKPTDSLAINKDPEPFTVDIRVVE